jgi:hypothetical protein
MKIPLRDYLVKKTEELKVFLIKTRPGLPIRINVKLLVEKYGFNPTYDSLRLEEMPVPEFISDILSGFLPAHLAMRRLDVDNDWFLIMRIDFDGRVNALCNDNEKASRFFEDVIVGFPFMNY